MTSAAKWLNHWSSTSKVACLIISRVFSMSLDASPSVKSISQCSAARGGFCMGTPVSSCSQGELSNTNSQ